MSTEEIYDKAKINLEQLIGFVIDERQMNKLYVGWNEIYCAASKMELSAFLKTYSLYKDCLITAL